jgi:hypothetical protein
LTPAALRIPADESLAEGIDGGHTFTFCVFLCQLLKMQRFDAFDRSWEPTVSVVVLENEKRPSRADAMAVTDGRGLQSLRDRPVVRSGETDEPVGRGIGMPKGEGREFRDGEITLCAASRTRCSLALSIRSSRHDMLLGLTAVPRQPS